MSAKITPRQVGDVTILDCAGRITLGVGANLLRDAIQEHRKGNKKLAVNFDEVASIDSSGLGELGSASVSMQKISGEKLTLFNLNERLIELLTKGECLEKLHICDNETDAVRSVNGQGTSAPSPSGPNTDRLSKGGTGQSR